MEPAPATAPMPQPTPEPQPAPEPPHGGPSHERGARRIARIAAALVVAAALVAGVGMGLPMLRPLLGPQEGEVREVDPIGSEWHAQRLAEPPPFDERVLRASVQQVATQPERYQGRLVRVDDRVAGMSEHDAGTLLSIGEGTDILTGYYPAQRADVGVGQAVTAVGIVSPDGADMIVLAISEQAQEVEDGLLALAWQTLLVAGGFFVAAVFVRVRGGIDRRRRRSAPLAGTAVVLMTALLLTGCDINMTTTVSQAGSGSVVTEIEMGEEQMNDLLGLPNAQPAIDSWVAELEQQGVTVARGDSTLRMTRIFDSCADFNSVPYREGESWSYLQAIPMGDGTHFVFAGLLDTGSLQAEQGVYDEDGRVFEELESRTEETVFASTVVLPGTVLGARGGAPEWRVALGEADRLFVESVVRGSSRSEAIAPGLIDAWRVALDWTLAVVVGLFGFGLVAYPWRTKERR